MLSRPAVPSSRLPDRTTPTTRFPALRARAPEEGIDRGTGIVLLGPPADREPPVAQHQVAVWPGDVDAAGREGVAVLGVGGGEGAGTTQDPGEDAAGGGWEVDDHENRGRKLGRERSHQFRKRLGPARGCADHDDVSFGHQ